MADIRPFSSIHYNPSIIDDISSTICPPYDIIPPQLQQELYLRHEYNFIRLEYGRELPQDGPADNRYTRAAATLEQWLKQGVLVADEQPAIYLHDQYFTLQKKEHKRRNIFARVRLEDWEKMVIRPHEGTTAEPKSDRLSLLWTLKANTSPVLGLYEDPERRVASILRQESGEKPLLMTRERDGERHVLWGITDAGAVGDTISHFAGRPIYIADGHHRYESALAYKRERIARSPSVSGEEAFNFVMMALVEFSDPGLVILPPHRLVRGISRPTLDKLPSRLATFFEVEELLLDMPDLWHRVDGMLANRQEVRLAVYGLSKDRLLMLTLRDPESVSQMMPYFHTEIYRWLDVSVLDHVILENMLAMDSEKEKTLLGYTYDHTDAINRVTGQEYQLAFILRPVKAGVIKAIADARDKMPRKSTYFYPKLPSGLLLNRVE